MVVKFALAVNAASISIRRRGSIMQRLHNQYREEIIEDLMQDFGYDNVMQVPRIRKVVINIGMGEALDNPKSIEFAVNDLRTITGQQPVVTRAKKSIANFKLREGRAIGVKVTLRGGQMWAFLDRLINVALPRTRDFRGTPDKFDGRGNYTLGLREQLLFPEIGSGEWKFLLTPRLKLTKKPDVY